MRESLILQVECELGVCSQIGLLLNSKRIEDAPLSNIMYIMLKFWSISYQGDFETTIHSFRNKLGFNYI